MPPGTTSLTPRRSLLRPTPGPVSPRATLAVAWALSRGEEIVPLIGARTRIRLHEALGALDITLRADDLAAIERAVPAGAAAGERYNTHGMASLDSERK